MIYWYQIIFQHSHPSVWRSWGRASLIHFYKYIQQDATLYKVLYYCQCSTYFRRFLRPSSGAQKLNTASVICQACLLLPVAVAASKLDIYRMLCVQFLSSWWWAEEPPETCRALTVINNFVYRCILLVVFKEKHTSFLALLLSLLTIPSHSQNRLFWTHTPTLQGDTSSSLSSDWSDNERVLLSLADQFKILKI